MSTSLGRTWTASPTLAWAVMVFGMAVALPAGAQTNEGDAASDARARAPAHDSLRSHRRAFGWGAVGAGTLVAAAGAWMGAVEVEEDDGWHDRVCVGSTIDSTSSCAVTGAIQMVAGALLGAAGLVVALDEEAALGWLDVTLRTGPQLGLLHGPFAGDSGPWLNAGAAFEVGSSGSIHLHVEPNFVIGRVSRSLDESTGSLTAETRTVTVDESTSYVGTLTRLQAGAGWGGLVVRAGPALGYAAGSYQADACGERSYGQPLFGASGTAAYRFGGARQLELGFLIDLIAVEYPQCRSWQAGPEITAPLVLRIERADNVGWFAGLTLGYAP